MVHETCSRKKAAPKSILQNLHPSQAGEGRHKCPVCAYAAGFAEGFEIAKSQAIKALGSLRS